jgi:hypothetical protein
LGVLLGIERKMEENASGDAATEQFPALGGDQESVYKAVFREMEDAVFVVDVKWTDGEC